MISSDRELDALERIHLSQSPVRQRDLARVIGLSLGMTNAILKRLAQKGLLQVRKVNNRNIQYVVSAKGLEEIARRSYRYLKRTIKNVVYYKEAIEELLGRAAARGYKEVALVGASDLDFIVEHLCGKRGLGFSRAGKAVPRPAEQRFLLYSENNRTAPRSGQASASLRQMMLPSRPRISTSVAS
jgi:DNA-binding MarR family transcriptional regulator